MAKNTLEHHAVFIALLAKHAMKNSGERGKTTFIEGVSRLGMERGTRMAARAVLHGDKLTLGASQAYSEWRDDEGETVFTTERTTPTLITRAKKCAWNTYWRQHDLLEYGRYFCVTIDNALVHGFNGDFGCNIISNMSWGSPCCEFDWGRAMSDDEVSWVAKRKKELGGRCVKDFDYHLGHIIHSVGGEMREKLEAAGQKAVRDAKSEFERIFGTGYLEAAEDAYPGTL